MSNNTYQIGMADGASCDCDIAEILGFQTALSPAEEAPRGRLPGGQVWHCDEPIRLIPPAAQLRGQLRRRRSRSPPSLPAARRPFRRQRLSVTKGLACWFDAAVGVTADNKGAVRTWKDLSGNDHHAQPAAALPPCSRPTRSAHKPAVQFRKGWLALDGKFFAKEHYLVIRSPGPKWSGAGWPARPAQRPRLELQHVGQRHRVLAGPASGGRFQERRPCCPGPAFDCSPLTRFMVLKIIVNDHNETEAVTRSGTTTDWRLAILTLPRSLVTSPCYRPRTKHWSAAIWRPNTESKRPIRPCRRPEATANFRPAKWPQSSTRAGSTAVRSGCSPRRKGRTCRQRPRKRTFPCSCG